MPNTDKMILLPQLQRYDQKIKGWADNKFLTKADTPSLPKATATTLGGVKVGNGLNVTDDGVLSAEDDIVFTWDFDTSAFSCNKTFAEVKKIITTGVRRTATANGLLENFSITLLAGAANDNGVMFFGTAPGDALGSGMLGSKTDGTITYLFQKGLVILYNSNGQIQMTEDLSNLNTNMSFDFKNTTFKYDRYNSFDLKDGGITSAKLADSSIKSTKIAPSAITRTKIADDAIEENHIRDGQITVTKIKDGSVTSAKLALGAVNTENIKDGAIVAANIVDGGITSAKLRDGAVTVTKLTSGAVNTDRIADRAVTSIKLADNAVTAAKIKNGAITADKLANGGITSAKLADGAITKAKLSSDVVIPEAYTLPEATASTLGGVKVYGVLSSNLIDSPVVPLAKSKDNLLVLQTYASRNSNKIDGYVVTQTDNKQYPGIILKNKTVTTDKIADGAITADKLASGVGGGISISILTNIKKENENNNIYVVHPDYPSVSFYINCGYIKISDISNFIYGQIDAGDYIGLCIIGIGYCGNSLYGSSSGSISLCQTSTISNLNPTVIGLSGPGIENDKSTLFNSNNDIILPKISITPTFNFVPKSTSAQAALASLLPVQDECKEMEAEVAKLEQDWIDNSDETVAVDGNGVPITVATKKTELEKKQAELKKLREDYFSKLGDWKNEVQE